MTRVGILETGKPSDLVRSRCGDFPKMFRAYFSGQPDMEFSDFCVFDGSPLPEPNAQDAWLITGSPAGVYEDHAWLEPLRNFVRASVAQSVPTLGICFGHQLMAQALGGVVTKSNKGQGLGVHSYTLTATGEKLLGGGKAMHLVASHQDQVVEPPANAVLLATSDFCAYAALAYGDAGLSIQGHPEFSTDVGRDAVTVWQRRATLPQDTIDAALKTLDTVPPDSQRLAPVLRDFLAGRTVS